MRSCRAGLARVHSEHPPARDLYVGNVLFENKRWYIVDWESFGLTHLPGYDVYTLLLSAGYTETDPRNGVRN